MGRGGVKKTSPVKVLNWPGGLIQFPQGGCEEELCNERKGLLHRGHTDICRDGHCNFMTESAQWADSVKILQLGDN